MDCFIAGQHGAIPEAVAIPKCNSASGNAMESCQCNEAIRYSPPEGLGDLQKLTEEGVWPGAMRIVPKGTW